MLTTVTTILTPVEQPTMCNTDQNPSTELDEELTLNCTAVGPGPMNAQWTASEGKITSNTQ